jgi:hypothetical protein
MPDMITHRFHLLRNDGGAKLNPFVLIATATAVQMLPAEVGDIVFDLRDKIAYRVDPSRIALAGIELTRTHAARLDTDSRYPLHGAQGLYAHGHPELRDGEDYVGCHAEAPKHRGVLVWPETAMRWGAKGTGVGLLGEAQPGTRPLFVKHV